MKIPALLVTCHQMLVRPPNQTRRRTLPSMLTTREAQRRIAGSEFHALVQPRFRHDVRMRRTQHPGATYTYHEAYPPRSQPSFSSRLLARDSSSGSVPLGPPEALSLDPASGRVGTALVTLRCALSRFSQRATPSSGTTTQQTSSEDRSAIGPRYRTAAHTPFSPQRAGRSAWWCAEAYYYPSRIPLSLWEP